MKFSILSEGANFMEKFSLSIHTDIDTPTNTDTFLKILPIPIQIWPILINPTDTHTCCVFVHHTGITVILIQTWKKLIFVRKPIFRMEKMSTNSCIS